jgi:hypothetical protein
MLIPTKETVVEINSKAGECVGLETKRQFERIDHTVSESPPQRRIIKF